MTYTTDPELRVLHAVGLVGFAEPAAVAEATALPIDDVTDALAKVAAGELVAYREGRVSGWSLTPAGKAEHAARIGDERRQSGSEGALEQAYQRFLDANETLKLLCTDWQLRTVAGELVPNDHADALYDDAIAARLVAHHGEVAPTLADIAAVLSRFDRYEPRLGAAVDRFVAGEREALARPLSGSYHDVWMELHQDFLLSLSRTRSAADGH